MSEIITDDHICYLGLSVRSYGALWHANIRSINKLSMMSIFEISQIRNIGKKSLEEIIRCLEKRGLWVSDGYNDIEPPSKEIVKPRLQTLDIVSIFEGKSNLYKIDSDKFQSTFYQDKRIKQRDINIILYKYGFIDGANHTYKNTGEVAGNGITGCRVTQIIYKTFRLLMHPVRRNKFYACLIDKETV